MRITEVEPILLKGTQTYGATSGAEEATDNGDWQLLIRVATDEGLTGWADVETLAPAAVAIIAGQGMADKLAPVNGRHLRSEPMTSASYSA